MYDRITIDKPFDASVTEMIKVTSKKETCDVASNLIISFTFLRYCSEMKKYPSEVQKDCFSLLSHLLFTRKMILMKYLLASFEIVKDVLFLLF